MHAEGNPTDQSTYVCVWRALSGDVNQPRSLNWTYLIMVRYGGSRMTQLVYEYRFSLRVGMDDLSTSEYSEATHWLP